MSYWNWCAISCVQHVLELGVGAGERHDGAVPREVGDAAGALAAHLGRVGLQEVGVRGVQDDRLALAELVVQHLREPGVVPLRHPGRVERGRPLAVVVVDVEMLGLDDLEVEVGVLDLVLAEVLGGQQARRAQQQASRTGAVRRSMATSA